MNTQIAKQRPNSPIAWLEDETTLGKLAEANTSEFNAVAFKRAVLTSIAGTPKLAACTVASFANCALECAQLGLSPGPAGHVYLIPRDKKKKDASGQWKVDHTYCTIIVGYRGLIHAIRRSVPGIFVDAIHVYEGDVCSLRFAEKPDHEIAMRDRGKSIGVYAAARIPGCDEWNHVWMPSEELDEIRETHAPRDWDKNITGPWLTDRAEMERKTALRRLAKILPSMPMVDQMLNAEDDGPRQVIDVTPKRRGLAALASSEEPLLIESSDDAEATA